MANYKRLLEKPARSFFLFGPRGCGKSTWLRQSFPNALTINLLDEKRYQALLADVGLFAKILGNVPPGGMVVVDEIQRLPHLLNEVHRLIEERGLRFALSGSSARRLKAKGVNLLAGRAIRKELFPLVRQELGHDFDLDKILRFGSLPLLWNAGGEREVMEAYVETYLKSEIQMEAIVRNLPAFARFLPVAALFHGQVLSVSSLARDASVHRPTVSGYLDILVDTLLAYLVPPFEARLRVKEKKHPKVFWIDPGIVRAVKRQFGEIAHEERGLLFEGWIATTLLSYKQYRGLFDEWYYWSPTQSDALEVDFLLVRGNECIAIEAKSTTRYRTEYAKGLQIIAAELKRPKPVRTIVVYCGDERLKDSRNIEVLPYGDFLDLLESGTLWPS